MALGAEDFDFEGLGSKLTNTILDSFDDAIGKIELSSVATSLTTAFKTVDMSKVIDDSLTKNPKVIKSMTDIQKKLEDGFNKINFKVGDIVIPELPEQVIKVTADTTSFKLQEQKPINVPVTAGTQSTQAETPTISTGPLEKAGDLVREFVNLTQEANKKTAITIGMYTKIVDLAEKLVTSKRMEKGAADDIAATLGKKLDVPPVEVSAKVTDVNTDKVGEVTKKSTKIKADVETGSINISGLEKTMTTFLTNLKADITEAFAKIDFGGINKTLGTFLSKLKTSLTDVFANINFGGVEKAADRVFSRKPIKLVDAGESIDEVTELISEMKQLDVAQKILEKGAESEYKFAQKRLDLNRSLSATQLADLQTTAQTLNIKNAELLTETQLRTAIKNKIVDLYKEKDIREDMITATTAVASSYKGYDVNKIVSGLTIELGLTEDIVAEKAQALMQENLIVNGVAALTEEQKKSLKLDNDILQLTKDQASATAELVTTRNQVNQAIKSANLSIQTQEVVNQLGLMSEEVKQRAQAIIQQKIINGQSAELTNSEMQTLFYMDQEINVLKERLGISQKVTEATDALNKSIDSSLGLASVLESSMYVQLGLSQDLTREKAQAIILDGIKKGLSQDEINLQLQILKNEDIVLQKTRERVDASKDLEAAADAYAKAVRQADADLQIKNLIIGLRLTEDEVAQEARLLAVKNEQLAAAGNLTKEELAQIQANNGLTNAQVVQLKLNNQTLRHRREEVELVEHVANYQKEINEELEKYSMGWKKTKATITAILKDPTLAKGVIIATGIETIHKMTHAMHEFKDTGMDAAQAVQAQFHSFSIASVLGLSKSVDVTKTLASQYGNINALTKEETNNVGKLAANNGLAGDEATSMVMAMSRMPGMTRESASHSEDMFKSIGKTKGVIPAQIMKEMAKNTANMAIYSKGGAQGFAMAAASAKKMGVELNTVLSAARKSLDFESSLNAQMEASVMLGKELNMDKLRQATLSGDANAIMREQQDLIRQAGGLENMNVLQKEKLAEMMGMSVEDMQKMNDQAQFQNKYFGEQAGLMSNIMGYAMKYGEAIGGAVTQYAPVIAAVISLASNMMMLNAMKASSVGATTADTGATVANTGAKAANTAAVGANNAVSTATAAAKGVDTLAINTNTTASRLNEVQMRAYKAMRMASIPATQAMAAARTVDTGATTANTAATTANASAGGFWNTIKRISNGIMNSSIVLWIREKVGIVLSTAAYYAQAAAQGIWNAAKAVGNFLMSTSLGMWVAEKVNIAASTVAKWLNVGANTAVAESSLLAAEGSAASGTAAAGASGGFMAFGAALGTFGTLAAPVIPVLLAIGAAILLATPALYVLGEVVKSIAVVIGNVLMKAIEAIPSIIDAVARGFVTVFQTLAASWPILFPLSLGLYALGGALAFVGGTAMAVSPGLLAVSAVLAAAAAAMLATGFAVKMIAEAFTQLTSIKTETVFDFAKAIGILALTAALLAPAAGLMIIGAIGIAALGLALIPMTDALQKIATIDMGAIKQFSTGLIGLGAATAFIGLTAPFILLGAGALLILAKAVDPLSEAFVKLSTLKADNLLEFGKNIMGFAVATAYLGLMSPLIVLGAASIFALSIALKPMAEAFKLASEVKPESLMSFGKAVVGFGLAASYLGMISPLIVLGSISIGMLGLAMQPVAKAFQMIQGLDFGAVTQFGKTLGTFAIAAAGLGIYSPLILLGSIAIGYLGMALVPAARAFEMVQKLDMKTVENFGITLSKFAIAAAAIAPLAPLMLIGALGIGMLGLALQPVAKAFQMVSGIDAKGLELFAYSLGKFSAIAAGLGYISPLMILGATGIVILGKGLDLVAGAFQKVSGLDSKSIENFGFALGKFSAIAAGLGIVSPLILLGSYAILSLGSGLGAVADTFIKVGAIDSKKLEEFGTSIGKFALKAALLAPISPLIFIGAAAIGALGMSLMPFATALSIAAPASEQMANVLQRLATKETIDGLSLLTKSLLSVASALGKVGIAGLIALPGLGALSMLAPTLGPSKVEGAAPTATNAPPAKIQTQQSTITSTTTTSQPAATPTAAAPSGGDMSALLGKLDQLISLMQTGGTITMDGQKVATIVQKNIRSIKFNS